MASSRRTKVSPAPVVPSEDASDRLIDVVSTAMDGIHQLGVEDRTLVRGWLERHLTDDNRGRMVDRVMRSEIRHACVCGGMWGALAVPERMVDEWVRHTLPRLADRDQDVWLDTVEALARAPASQAGSSMGLGRVADVVCRRGPPEGLRLDDAARLLGIIADWRTQPDRRSSYEHDPFGAPHDREAILAWASIVRDDATRRRDLIRSVTEGLLHPAGSMGALRILGALHADGDAVVRGLAARMLDSPSPPLAAMATTIMGIHTGRIADPDTLTAAVEALAGDGLPSHAVAASVGDRTYDNGSTWSHWLARVAISAHEAGRAGDAVLAKVTAIALAWPPRWCRRGDHEGRIGILAGCLGRDAHTGRSLSPDAEWVPVSKPKESPAAAHVRAAMAEIERGVDHRHGSFAVGHLAIAFLLGGGPVVPSEAMADADRMTADRDRSLRWLATMSGAADAHAALMGRIGGSGVAPAADA